MTDEYKHLHDLADVEHERLQDALAASGMPILYGPYTVDYTDLLHDGATKVLWTPAVGDVLLALAVDERTRIEGLLQGSLNFNNGGISFGTADQPQAFADGRDFSNLTLGALRLPWTFTAAVAVQVRRDAYGDPDLIAGHLELYALVARAVKP